MFLLSVSERALLFWTILFIQILPVTAQMVSFLLKKTRQQLSVKETTRISKNVTRRLVYWIVNVVIFYFLLDQSLRKVSLFGVILVRIFPHSDWIRKIRIISPYSVLMRENADQNNSEYRYFSGSECSVP